VPVIAVGVPTVVDASTLAGDLLAQGAAEPDRELFQPESFVLNHIIYLISPA
jgi:hypothetical protein